MPIRNIPIVPGRVKSTPHFYVPLINSDFTFLISRTIPNEPNDEEDKDTHFEYQGCNFNEPIIAMDGDDLDEDDELEIPDEMSRLIEHDDKGIVPNP